MKNRDPFLLSCYCAALGLYPRRFRRLYHDPMLQAARDAHAESSLHPIRFWSRLFADLLQSSLKEHLSMTRDQAMRRPVFFHAVTLGLILTLWGGAAAITMQQMLRRGANHPQVEMALRYTRAIAAGNKPEDLLPSNRIDLQTSLEPFAIFYNGAGVPVASTATLNDQVPSPPAGVFDHARRFQDDTITWQPQPGVRMAAVVRRVDGPMPGFVLTGRSLQLVEDQESALRRGTFVTWFILMSLLALGALFLSRAQARPLAAA